jgi:NADP-dependent 3-hydroxy acid dehydrogenase YdfG
MPIETVVITGASAGVGRAATQAFAKRRARLGLLARGVDRLSATAREVRAAGGEALVLPTDVADADAVEAAGATVEREFGPIDIWINNAMATVFAPVSKLTPEEYRRATEVTYLGCVYGTMAALRRMLPRNHGTIVQVGSALAYRAIPLQAPYCGAKYAIRGFTDSLRCELLHENSNVHVTMVRCRRSVRRNSTGRAIKCRGVRGRWARSFSPNWLPRRSFTPLTQSTGKSGSADRLSRRSSETS